MSDYTPSINNAMIGFGADGKFHYTNKAVTQTFLDINNGTTLSNDITGNAGAAALWGGRGAELSNSSALMFAPIVIDGSDGKAKLGTVSQFQLWLGSPSGGETLPSVLARGNIGSQGQVLALRATDPANGYLELKNVLNSNGSAFRLVSGVWALSQDGFSIYNNNNGTNFHIAESGNVGIGYISDQGYKFAVNGTSLFSGGMVINGGTTINAVLSVNGIGAFSGDVTAPSFRASNWFRSTGNTGWYNETYDGGIYMSDANWLRVYNSKGLWADNQIRGTEVISQYNGYKSNSFRGLVGDYELTSSTDKIIWTIGSSWNTIESMYGIGYQYSSKYISGHQIVFRENGVVRASIDTSSGSGFFDGTVTATKIKATQNLAIPSAPPISPEAGIHYIYSSI